MRILITGGAGFVGSQLALAFRETDRAQVTVLDNLHRRGSELNLMPFREKGIKFFHGDIRNAGDIEGLEGNFDLTIEASAEPSVAAGQQGSPSYVVGTNLFGTLNCLEFARRRAGLFLFLSTSRVYSIASLREIRLDERETRFEIAPRQDLPGVSARGISENFPTARARSFYGTTKLASEMLIQEYVETYSLKALINRCGVVVGPGQFGKVDQGVFTFWVAHHYFGIRLRYTGFGGKGKQVRDLLHPADLVSLLRRQLECTGEWDGQSYNVGGGRPVSVSLQEMTAMCREIVGREVEVGGISETASYDVPLYLTDAAKVSSRFQWAPQKGVSEIIREILQWIKDREQILRPLFC